MSGPKPYPEQDDDKQTKNTSVDGTAGGQPKTDKPVRAHDDKDERAQQVSDSKPSSGGGN